MIEEYDDGYKRIRELFKGIDKEGQDKVFNELEKKYPEYDTENPENYEKEYDMELYFKRIYDIIHKDEYRDKLINKILGL